MAHEGHAARARSEYSRRVRVMGLDFGTKTIGVAVSDELALTGQGVTTIRRTGIHKDIEALREIVRARDVQRVVLGLPLNMDGSEGPRAADTRAFAARLESSLALPVELWDERLTTVAAERALLEANMSREKRRAVIDQVAASLILQSWLDAQRPQEADD